MKALTVQELADELGISKQAVSKYENGISIPTTDNIVKILNYFGISRGYLTKPEIRLDETTAVFYRRNKKTKKKEIEKASVYLKWCYEIIIACRHYNNMTMFDIPDLTDVKSIHEKTLLLRKYWDLGSEPVVNMADVLGKHGIYIFTVMLDNKDIDGYSQIVENIPIIILNMNKSGVLRSNFSLAHELGHLILHNKLRESDDYDIDKIEEEANEFAGCFLMPEEKIQHELIRKDVNYFVNLGARWNVSPQAVVMRFYKLGLLGKNLDENKAVRDAMYLKLNKKVSDSYENGFKICSINEMIREISNQRGIREEFLEKLCLPIKEIRRLCLLEENVFSDCTLSEEIDMDGVQLSFLN